MNDIKRSIMVKLIHYLLIIFISIPYAEKILVQNDKYLIYSVDDISTIDISRINSNLKKLVTLDSIMLIFENSTCTREVVEYPLKFTVVVKTDNTIVYKNNFYEFQLSNNNVIHRMSSNISCNVVDSTISSNELVKRAKHFFEEILIMYGKKNEIIAYDSTSIGTMNNLYFIRFRCKQKSDVYDNRKVEIVISGTTGKIHSYSGEIYQKYNMNYKPQISKQEAINKIAEKFSINASDIIIKEMYLKQVKRFGKEHWVWSTSMHIGKGKNKLFKFLYLDCSTGEINVMNN